MGELFALKNQAMLRAVCHALHGKLRVAVRILGESILIFRFAGELRV